MFDESDNIFALAARMNNQKQIEKRNKALGPPLSRESIQQRFRRFHASNPEVYNELVSLARRLKSSGVTRYGIVGLYEVIRYDRFIKTDGKPYKLSNDFRSRYARLIMENEPDLVEFFRTRELTAL
jgi:hypothetical protein